MNTDALVRLLRQASATPAHTPAPVVGPYLAKILEYRPTVEAKALAALIEQLRIEPKLDLFDDKMQMITTAEQSFGHAVSYDVLATWLVWRTLNVGAQTAVDDLVTYVEASEIPCVEVLAIAGLEVEEAVELGSGVWLVPMADVPDSLEKWQVTEPVGFLGMGLLSHVGQVPAQSALTLKCASPKLHLRKDEDTPRPSSVRTGPNLFDLCFLLTLIGPSAPVPVALWISADVSVPCTNTGSGMSQPILEGRSGPVSKISSQQTARVNELYLAFAKLSDDERRHLLIALSRLNLALRR